MTIIIYQYLENCLKISQKELSGRSPLIASRAMTHCTISLFYLVILSKPAALLGAMRLASKACPRRPALAAEFLNEN
jgi:hypothetical protein